jgi:hypothetical protein
MEREVFSRGSCTGKEETLQVCFVPILLEKSVVMPWLTPILDLVGLTARPFGSSPLRSLLSAAAPGSVSPVF